MAAAKPYAIAIVGVGKIARDQHLPSISRDKTFRLAAGVSRNARIDGVPNYTSLDAFLAAEPNVPVVALCQPPQARFAAARTALEHRRHVLLEKPPGATLSEVEQLVSLAREKGVTLFATWHSRFAPAVAAARKWLTDKKIRSAKIVWKEDVRRWHPGQAWIWEPGGMGVFDPGINALSVLTEIYPREVHLTSATLEFPENCQTPIAAKMSFDDGDTSIEADFDWRQEGPQSWDIVADTDGGRMLLSAGGSVLAIDGKVVSQEPEAEYDGIYRRFAELLDAGASDVDVRPLRHVADAFMLGRRVTTDAFYDPKRA
jgi:D-galactose 1-dehydrogenase